MSRKKPSRPARRRSPVFYVLLAGGVALLAYGGWHVLRPVPEVALATGTLEPPVAALIGPLVTAAAEAPRVADRHAELGLAYEANGLWPEALASYSTAVALDDDVPGWRLHLARAQRQAGDAAGAMATLTDLTGDFPNYAPAPHHLGEALLEAGDLARAEAAFGAAISLAPATPYGYVGLGDVLIQQGRFQDAATVLEQALQREADYRRAHFLLGTAYTRLGKIEEGEQAMQRGLGAVVAFFPDELEPRIASYTVNLSGRLILAGAHLDRGNPAEAVRLLEETFRYYPSDVMLLNTLASGYLRQRRLDDAHRLLSRAMPLDSTTFMTPLNLFQWALYTGQMEEALRFADLAVARAPDRDNTQLARAQALSELGRLEEALTNADRARALGPAGAQNHGLSGDLCQKLGRMEEAQRHFQRAATLEPAMLPAWIGLAETSQSLGDLDEARRAFDEARRLAPDHRRVAALAATLNTP